MAKMRMVDKIKMSLEGVTIAVDAMRANKVRASLTILGVAVGVFVVVVMSAAVHGINDSVAKQFEAAGPTTFFVFRWPITFEACDDSADTCTWRSNPRITFGEADALARLGSVAEVMPQQNWSVQARYRVDAAANAASAMRRRRDRKSTRLNSSHSSPSRMPSSA